MRDLALQLEISRDPPTLDAIRERVEDWADELDDRAAWCTNCDDLQQEVQALEMELMEAVDDFAELEAWRKGKDAWKQYCRDRAGSLVQRLRRSVFGSLALSTGRVSWFFRRLSYV
jgi:predicted  nucleic acid-binding Zn-ribbon protein